MERNAWFTPQVRNNTYKFLGLDVELSGLKKKIKALETENLALETTIATQASEIIALELRVEELETPEPEP